MESRNRTYVIANTITLAVMLFANFVAGSGAFSTTSVGEISKKYDTLFAPASYAFTIWSFIFLLTTAFVIYQWILLRRGDPNGYIKRISYWFTISNLANTLWLFCWINELLGWSVLIILILLFSLLVLTVRFKKRLSNEPVKTILLIWWPITFYLGWMMVATIACIAAWLDQKGWYGGAIGQEMWTVIMISITTLLYVLLVTSWKVREAAIVGIWAFIAIAVKQWHQYHTIAVTAIIASVILFLLITFQTWQKRQIMNDLK